MTEFVLEDRYIVLKRKRLKPIDNLMIDNTFTEAKVGCLVIEEDWPEYPIVLEMLRKRVESNQLSISAVDHSVSCVSNKTGKEIIEEALKKVSSGNEAEAPFPLVDIEARIWINATASAYQHALEMWDDPVPTLQKPLVWFWSEGKNYVISDGSKQTQGSEHVFSKYDIPLYKYPIDWTPISAVLPPEGEPFQAFHKDWIDEDFNHLGIRECHRYGDGTEYASAKWFDHQDCWIRDEQTPTHWRPYPKIPQW